jgi:hypothetical protein
MPKGLIVTNLHYAKLIYIYIYIISHANVEGPTTERIISSLMYSSPVQQRVSKREHYCCLAPWQIDDDKVRLFPEQRVSKKTTFIVFHLTRPRLEPSIYSFQGEHANTLH